MFIDETIEELWFNSNELETIEKLEYRMNN